MKTQQQVLTQVLTYEPLPLPEIKEEVLGKRLLCISPNDTLCGLEQEFQNIRKISSFKGLDIIRTISDKSRPDAVVIFGNEVNEIFLGQVQYCQQILSDYCIPLIAVVQNLKYDSDGFLAKVRGVVLKNGADDCYTEADLNPEKLNAWIDFLTLFKKLAKEDSKTQIKPFDFRVSFTKRLFDIASSAIALLLLSPIMLFIALIIRFESSGPVFYISKRAGSGYRIFNFLKFRTMKQGADKEIVNLSHLNQYSNSGSSNKKGATFFKIQNDPRVTRFGSFLRNSSLDEIPQLINVLIGDMSIVGNRPLPLYEAKQLTNDECAMRFMAPAGLTGLWQVTKRGKKDISEQERIALDIYYAKSNTFLEDLNLVLRTFPVVFQEVKA